MRQAYDYWQDQPGSRLLLGGAGIHLSFEGQGRSVQPSKCPEALEAFSERCAVDPPPSLASGRKNRDAPPLVSPLHRSMPRRARVEAAGSIISRSSMASESGGISPRSLHRMAALSGSPSKLARQVCSTTSDPYPWGIHTSSSALLYGKGRVDVLPREAPCH